MHGRAILHLDPEEGLKIVFRRFGFSTKCHLGPTGALRTPLGDFTRIQKNHLNRINEELVMQQHEFEVLRTAAISENGDQSCPSGNPIRDEHSADGDLCVQQEGQTGSVAWDGTHDRNGLDKDRGEALVHHGAGDDIDVPADVAQAGGGDSLFSMPDDEETRGHVVGYRRISGRGGDGRGIDVAGQLSDGREEEA